VALRSFGALRAPQDDKLWVFGETNSNAATVVDGESPATTTNRQCVAATTTTNDQSQERVILSGAKDFSIRPLHILSANHGFPLTAATERRWLSSRGCFLRR
jgi:hypothetical protein